MRKYLQLVFLAVSVFCSEILLAESRDPVRILDLRTLNELDLKEQEKGWQERLQALLGRMEEV